MKFDKKIRKYAILLFLAFLFAAAVSVTLHSLIRKPEVQQYLLKKVCIGYGLDVKTGKMELHILGTPGVVFHDVEVGLRGRSCCIVTTSVTVNFSRRRLLRGELIPVSVDIDHPIARIAEADVRAFFGKKKGGSHKMPFFCYGGGVDTFDINDGELVITGPSDILVNNLSASLKHVTGTSNTYRISAGGRVGYKGEKSGFRTESTIDINPDDVLKSVFSASLETENTPVTWIPLPAKRIDFQKGFLTSKLNISGDLEKGINAGGSVNFKSAVFTLFHKNRSKKYDIPELKCSFNASFKDKVIHVDSLNMKNRDLDLDADLLLDLNNRQNPHIKLVAKSKFMPINIFRIHFPFQITKPWLRDKLFPLFEDGMVRMDRLVLDGTVDQFRHLRDEANRSVIGVTFTCESFVISNMGIQIPFTGVSALVDIRDGNLKVSGLNGVFGDSKINEGSLDVQGLVSGHPMYKIFVDGDFDIQELLSVREMYVIPEKARERIEKYKDLTGRLSAKTVIGYRKDWRIPRILNGDYSFTDTLYIKRPLGLPLRFSEIDFHFSEDGNNYFYGNGVLGETQFNISGTTDISENKLSFTHTEIKAEADLSQLAKRSFGPEKFPFKMRSPVPLDFSIDKEGDTYKYKGTIDTEKLVVESDRILFHTVRRGSSISFNIIQKGYERLDIKNIEFRVGKSGVFLSGAYNLADKKLSALKISSEALSLGDLGIQFKGREHPLSGIIRGSLDLSFPGGKISGMQVTGNLEGDNISFIPGFLPLPVSECMFRLNLAGKNGFINRCDMKFGAYPLHLKGILHGWDKLKADLLVTADYMDLTEIVFNNRKAPRKKASVSGKDLFKIPDIKLKINSSRGVWRKLEFKRLNAEMNFSDKDIEIKNLQAELDTGDLSINGIIGRRGAGKINLSGKVKLEDQPIDKLISDMGFGDKGIKGTLALDSSASIDGNVGDQLLRDLSGNINSLILTNGLLKNSRVFLKILDLLNIPDKFKERPPEMREEGFYFEKIQGTARIEKGILTTEGFLIKSPAFNAVGSGEENLYKRTHDIRLLVQPLTNIDFIIKHIPILGPIFADKNETIFTVGYDVTGTWSKPRLDFAPEESLIGLFGVFKRALLRPYNILENINNAAKGMKNTAPEETGKSEQKSTEPPQPVEK